MLMLSVSCVFAQKAGDYSRAMIDSLVNPPLLKESERVLRFDSCVRHIGTVAESDSPRTYRFSFRNVSQKDVHITKINTSCGCTVATFDKKVIASGKESVITLAYNPLNRPGTVDTQAFVYTSVSDKYPVARLTLLGNVVAVDEWRHLPYSMGALRVKRKQVDFSEVTSSNRPSERVMCANSGKTPLKLSALLLPAYASFHTDPEVLQPGQEGDLVITVDGSKLPKMLGNSFQFPLVINGIQGRPSDRTMKVTIKRIQ